MHIMWRLVQNDAESVKGQKLKRGLVRRVFDYARPYKWMLVGFVVVIVAEALLGLAPALLFKRDHRRRHRQQGQHAPHAARPSPSSPPRSAARCWACSSATGRRRSAKASSTTSASQLFDHVQRLPDLVLHPDPDRRARQPPQQRRDRRAAGLHRARSAPSCRTSSRCHRHARRHGRARLAPDDPRDRCCCPCSSSRPSGSARSWPASPVTA